jgi:hypothetical protein
MTGKARWGGLTDSERRLVAAWALAHGQKLQWVIMRGEVGAVLAAARAEARLLAEQGRKNWSRGR